MRLVLIMLLTFVLPANAEYTHDNRRDELLGDCTCVQTCMDILTKALVDEGDETKGFIHGDEQRIAPILKQRFDRKARDVLLDKAIGPHKGWRNLASSVLEHWHDWEAADVPRLQRALRLNNGSGIAHALAEVGDDLAIEALMEDLLVIGYESQTGFALQQLGPRVLPYLLPALSTSAARTGIGGRSEAVQLVRELGRDAEPMIDQWLAVALDDDESIARRLGALRGLGAIANHQAVPRKKLHPLLDHKKQSLQAATLATLTSLRDPSVVKRIASGCKTSAQQFDAHGDWEFSRCIHLVGEFGVAGYKAGPILVNLLATSKQRNDKADVIHALGTLRYRPAGKAISRYLDSPHWQLVYAAAKALGELKQVDAVDGLQKIAETHWLPENRNLALNVIESLKSGKKLNVPREHIVWQDPVECSSHTWQWRQEMISLEDANQPPDKIVLEQPDGTFTGSFNGEFLGVLSWRPHGGRPKLLVTGNVRALLETSDSVLAVFGQTHLGSSHGNVISLSRIPEKDWEFRHVASFPAEAFVMARLKSHRFAAYSAGRVVVFSRDGVEGLATCAD